MMPSKTLSCAALISAVVVFTPPLSAHPIHSVAQATPSPLRNSPAAAPASTSPAPAVARLSVNIVDAKTGAATAARVRIADEAGRALGMPLAAWVPLGGDIRLAVPGSVPGLPPEAIAVMYGQNDTAQGYAFQYDGSFYVKGAFALPMPAGKFSMTITKGCEFTAEREELTFSSGDHVQRRYALRRWIDMPARGWYSADGHIHLRRSPRENPLILDWIAAEDVHVGVLLQVGDFWTTYFSQYGFGEKGRYGVGDFLLMSGQEDPRTGALGHTISFGAEQFVRFRDDYYSYDRVFDRIHALGGVSGYAHQAMSFQGYLGMTLDVLAGKIDFLELMQFCVPEAPLALEHYYRFLDLGFKVTALAGSDFPWCGRGRRPGEDQVGPQIGNARFYAQVGAPFSFERWYAAVRAGHTFATTGPMLELTVNGQPPGSAIDVKPGAKLRIAVTASGHAEQIPLRRVQLLAHGKVIAETKPTGFSQSPERLILEHELAPDHGLWIAARADAGSSQMAHTTPVYVTINRDGFHNRVNLPAQVEISKRYLDEIRSILKQDSKDAPQKAPSSPGPAAYPGTADRLEKRIAEAERKLEEISRLR